MKQQIKTALLAGRLTLPDGLSAYLAQAGMIDPTRLLKGEV